MISHTTTTFKKPYCGGTVRKNANGTVTVECTFEDGSVHDEFKYIAARPADRRASYSGSGFPFPNKQQAFDNTPTKGTVKYNGSTFQLTFPIPNSYYANLGNQLILPTLFISYKNASGKQQVIEIVVDDQIPYRLLQFPTFPLQRNDATFYHAHHNLPVRTQEQVLRDSEYPSSKKMASDYWGLRPAL